MLCSWRCWPRRSLWRCLERTCCSPGRHGKSGLLFMFAAVVTSLICLFVEMLSACALISGDRTPPHQALHLG